MREELFYALTKSFCVSERKLPEMKLEIFSLFLFLMLIDFWDTQLQLIKSISVKVVQLNIQPKYTVYDYHNGQVGWLVGFKGMSSLVG